MKILRGLTPRIFRYPPTPYFVEGVAPRDSGGNGEEQFWIVNGFVPSAAHTITDFELEIDRIGIRGLGITFQQLDLIQDGNDTRISVLNTDLAILSGIQASALNSSDFILA
ncbi:hypothetical protein [Coleofasciculus chthonoplastes]|uniref:hypothetical protein n=1 Tax=Coleofasciculus chthonoplastes TaxID=64178 RepID=UPI0032FD26AF